MNEEKEKYAELLEKCAEKIRMDKFTLQADVIGLIKQLSARVISENVNNNESKFKRKHLSPGEAALRKQLSGFENTKFDIVPPERRPTVESNKKMGIGLQSAIDANSHPIEWNPDVLDY